MFNWGFGALLGFGLDYSGIYKSQLEGRIMEHTQEIQFALVN
jgi:hypothetical protein